MNNNNVLNRNTSANILVVDDDTQVADMLKNYLNGRGYAVTAVYGGREALLVLPNFVAIFSGTYELKNVTSQ